MGTPAKEEEITEIPDLTQEQIDEVYKANPNLAGRIKKYADQGDEIGKYAAYKMYVGWKGEHEHSVAVETAVTEHAAATKEREEKLATTKPADGYIDILKRSKMSSQEKAYEDAYASAFLYYSSPEGGNMSDAQARIEATRQVMYWLVVPRALSGQPSEMAADIGPERYGEVSALEAWMNALSPQTLTSDKQSKQHNIMVAIGEEVTVPLLAQANKYARLGYSPKGAALELFGKPEEMSEESYKSLISEERRQAQKRVRTTGGKKGQLKAAEKGLDPRTGELKGQNTLIYNALAQAHLNQAMGRFFDESKQVVVAGAKSAGILLPDEYYTDQEQGVKSAAVNGSLTESEIGSQARKLAYSQHSTYQRITFPELDEPAKGSGPDQGWTWHDATLEGFDAIKRSLFFYERDQAGVEWAPQGQITETALMSGMRVLGGMTRLAVSPLVESLTYTVDEKGNPVDPTDINYRIAKATDEAHVRWESGGASIGDYGTLVGGYIHGAIAQFELDPSRTDIDFISTGNWIKDAAAAVGQGRHFGHDLQAIVGTGYMYQKWGMPNAPFVIGFLTELALPINPIKTAAPFIKTGAKLSSKGTRLTFDTLGELGGKLGASGITRDYLKSMGVTAARPMDFIASPVQSAHRSILYRELRAGLQGAGVKPAFSESGRLFREASLPGRAATRLAGEIMDKVMPSLINGTGDFAGVLKYAEDTGLGRVVHRMDDAWNQYRMGFNDASLLNKNKTGQQVLEATYAAQVAGHAPKTQEFHKAVMQGILEDMLREHMAHLIPDRWVVVGDVVLVAKEKWAKVGSKVQKTNRRLMEESAPGVMKHGRELVEILNNMIGREKIGASPFWSAVRTKLLNGQKLTNSEWMSATSMVTAGVASKEITGSVKISFAGPAYKQALERGAGRAKDYAKETRAANWSTVAKGAMATLGWKKGGAIATADWAPIEVSRMMADINAQLTQLPESFIEMLKDTIREGDTRPIQTLLTKYAGDDVIRDLIEILAVFFKKSELDKAFTGTKLRQLLVEQGFAGKALDERLVVRAIALARTYGDTLLDKGLMRGGFTGGARRVAEKVVGTTAKKAAKRDAPDAALYAWLMDKHKSEVLSGHVKKFTEQNPELVIRLGGDDITDAQSFHAIGQSIGISDDVLNAVKPVFFNRLGTGSALDPAHFQYLLREIFADLFHYGALRPKHSIRQYGLAIRQSQDVVIKETKAADGTGGQTIADVARLGDVRRRVKRIVENQYPTWTKREISKETNRVIDLVYASMIESAVGVDIANTIGKLRALGLKVPVARSGKQYRTGVKAEIVKLEGNLATIIPSELYTAAEKTMFKDLVDASASGKLWNSLDALKETDRNYAVESLTRFADTANNIAVSGILGGFPAMNLKYVGLNQATAVLIAMVTQPAYVGTVLMAMLNPKRGFVLGEATFKALNDAMGQAPTKSSPYRWFQSKVGASPDAVVMTDKWGRKWTKARLDHSIRTHNFRLSQTTFEFRNTILDQIRRTVAKNPDLSRAGWLKQAMRYLDPRNKNIWAMTAENTDNIFREACYIEALRRGLTENQAMSVARNVLLDYGAIPKIEKERIARAMLFYAFQRQMTMEVVKTLLFRDSRTVTSQIKWVMMQHREAGAWMYEDDYMRSYLWTKLTSAEEGYDDMPLQQSYVRAPAVEVFATIANLSFFVADTLDYHIFSKFADPNPEPWSRAQAEYPIPGIAEGSRRERYWTNHDIAMGLIEGTPWRNEFKTVMKLIVEPWGTRVTQQKQMPAEWIVAFESVGQFDLAVDLFDLRKVHEGPFGEGVDPGDIRAGYPLISTTIDGEKQFKTQYRMASQEGLENFIWLEYFTTALGIQRNIRDYTNLGVKMGWFPEGSQVKYMGDGDPVLYAAGVETTRVFKPEAHIMIEINKRILREMREQAKPR